MSQYWLVGANLGGHDTTDIFVRRGYWMMGWDDEDQPVFAQRRDDMQLGDGVAIKAGLGPGSSEIQIKALGIVVGFG